MSALAATENVVQLTESAAGQVKSMLAAEADSAGKGLRVYVEAGGCSGMQYGMVFDQRRPDDAAAECFGVSVFVDPVSSSHLRGAVVDFSDDLNAAGFKITNPNAHRSCGCGNSFEA